MVSNKTFEMINSLKDRNSQLRTDILATLYTIHQNEKNRKSKRRSRSRSRKRRSKNNKSRKAIKSRSRSRSRSRSNCKYGRKKTGRKGCKSKPGPKSHSRSRSRKSRKQHKGGHRSSLQHNHFNGGKKKSRSKTRRSLSKKSLTQKKRMVTKLLNKICKINNMTGGGIPQITGGCNAKCSR